MSTIRDISAVYGEFTAALTEVLAENAVGPARRGRLAKARAAVKNIPTTASLDIFLQLKLHSTIGNLCRTLVARAGPKFVKG